MNFDVYEMTMLIRSDIQPNDISSLMSSIKDELFLHNKEYKVVYSEYWGLRQFEYVINKNKSGHYYFIQFNGDATVNKVLLDKLKINDSVLRVFLVKTEEDQVSLLSPNSKVTKSDDQAIVFDDRYKQALSVFNI